MGGLRGFDGGEASRTRTPIGSWRRTGLVDSQFGNSSSAASYAASYGGRAPSERYFASRMHAVLDALARCPGGELVDVGCGPGMFVRRLLDTRPRDFRITALDRSPAMMREVAGRVRDADVRMAVGEADELPFPDGSFDVVVAMGVLEYCAIPAVLRECARVVRPGGLVLVTMLNPLSPYRMFEWAVYWPLLRWLGRAEGILGRRPRRHGPPRTGIRAVSSRRLARMMAAAGLPPIDVVHYDIAPAVPPLDQVLWRWSRRWRARPETTISRGARRWLGSAYLVVASRPA